MPDKNAVSTHCPWAEKMHIWWGGVWWIERKESPSCSQHVRLYYCKISWGQQFSKEDL